MPPRDQRPWLVLRFDVERNCWLEVACTIAATAGEAFRDVVLPQSGANRPPMLGEYRVLTLEDSAHLAVRLELKDLDAKDPLA